VIPLVAHGKLLSSNIPKEDPNGKEEVTIQVSRRVV